MGSRAKQLITDAEKAFKNVTRALSDLQKEFMAMVSTKEGSKQTKVELVKYAEKKYPGEDDLDAHVSTDSTLTQIIQDIQKQKKRSKDHRENARANLVILDQELKGAKDTFGKLDKLIVEKAKARGSGKIAKIKGALKTKSLGDLRKEKEKLDKLFETVTREVLGIRQYFTQLEKKAK